MGKIQHILNARMVPGGCSSRSFFIFWVIVLVRLALGIEDNAIKSISQRILETSNILLENGTEVPSNLSPLINGEWANGTSIDVFFNGLSDSGLLEDFVQNGSQYTIFVPVNEAFSVMEQTYLDQLQSSSWIVHYRNFLSFHVLPGAISLSEILSSSSVANTTLITLNGEEIFVSNAMKSTEGGGHNFTLSSENSLRKTNILQDEGLQIGNFLVYKVDSVLLPSFMAVDLLSLGNKYDGFQILVELLGRMGISSDFLVGSYTILAPTDQAFLNLGDAKLQELRNNTITALPKLLASHVIAGVHPISTFEHGSRITTLGGSVFYVNKSSTHSVKFNNATVIKSDILASNGIAHAIDAVLMLEGSEELSLENILKGDRDFERFTMVTQAAGFRLSSTDMNNVTLFVPTNEAFNVSSTSALISKLVGPLWAAHLLDLIQLHISQGFLYSKDLNDGAELTMVNGEIIFTKVNDTGKFLLSSMSTASINQLDLLGANGNANKIDSVLLPLWTNKTLTDCIGKFEMFHDLVSRSSFEGFFSDNDFTVFAPSDKALLALGREKLVGLIDPANRVELDQFVSMHVLEGVYPLQRLAAENVSSSIIASGDLQLRQQLAKNGILYGIDITLERPFQIPALSSVEGSYSSARKAPFSWIRVVNLFLLGIVCT